MFNLNLSKINFSYKFIHIFMGNFLLFHLPLLLLVQVVISYLHDIHRSFRKNDLYDFQTKHNLNISFFFQLNILMIEFDCVRYICLFIFIFFLKYF